MTEKPKTNQKDSFANLVGKKASDKQYANTHKSRSIWFGLGTMGIVGWAVAIPTLLGIALGVWLDSRYGGSRSWTLMMMVTGLFLGCLNAWHWVKKEEREIRRDKKDE